MVEQRMRMAAVDIDLGEHRKCHVILALAEFFDLFGVARLLPAELVAGKAEHRKAARRQFALQLLQALVLRREPAGARGIDDQEHLTFKPLQRNLFTGERTRREIINAWHRVLSKLTRRVDRRRGSSTGLDRLARREA
jgi:hypothetical protein